MARSLFISLLLGLSIHVIGRSQVNKEFVNPYVNKAELLWLKSKDIDLSVKPITDKDFIHNVRLVLDLKTKDNQALGKFAGLLAVSAFSFATYKFGDYEDETGAFTNTLIGTVGVTTGCLATKYFIDHSNLSSKKKQLLRLTQNQYKLIIQ